MTSNSCEVINHLCYITRDIKIQVLVFALFYRLPKWVGCLKMGVCCAKEIYIPPISTPVGHKCLKPAKSITYMEKKRKEKKIAKEKERMLELKATILIQKMYRVWRSKLQARRELAWHIFQKIEYYGERNQMRLNRFFCVLIDGFSAEDSLSRQVLRGENELAPVPSPLVDINELLEVPDTAGVNILPPFRIENLKGLMNFLKRGNSLHSTCVINLLIMTTQKMRTRQNINEISTSMSKKVTVVGDIHGSLEDLLLIFYKNDLPSISNPYIFNGDIVDRGAKAIEVLMILCYCFLLYPNHVHLNRGNHEDWNMNEKYGFTKEVMTKYRDKTDSLKIAALCKGLFREMPIGAVIDRKIFVVHGGISDITDLDILSEIQRNLFDSLIKPPRHVFNEKRTQWEQLMDILWSDPVVEDGCESNDYRGGGKLFGPDVTEQFLKDNNLELLIRSHECKPNGYAYDHFGKVLTIFSSSNYYHPGSNKGAYVVYPGDIKQIRIIQFISNEETLESLKFKANVVSMEKKAISELKCMMCTHRHQLTQMFHEKDVHRTGMISMDDYGNIMGKVLNIKLPWRLIQPMICAKDENNQVIYETCFNYAKEIEEESASEVLFNNMEILETIFRAIDKDNSGFVTMEEFSNAVSLLHKHSAVDIQLEDMELGELIDIDKNGVIDISEFFEAFKISRVS